MTLPQALLWRQWLVKSRTPITTLVEVLSPILLMSIVVYAYSLVEPELRPQRIYANRTSELVYNLSRDAARSQLASDLRLCAAILQPLPGGGGPAQQPAMQQGAGGRNPAQTGAGRPEEGSIVPPGRRRLRQETPRQTGGADPGFVPDFQAGGGTQDPAYLEWAAMHSGAAGGFEAASADVSDAADGAAGSAEAASAGGGDAAVADAGAEALPAGVSDSLTSTTGVAGRAGEDGAVDVVGGEPAAVSSALDSIPEPSAGTGDQDAAYLEWAAMQSGTAAGATTPAAVGDSPDGAGAADIMPDLLAHAEGPSGASKFPGAARPEAGNGVQDPAYLAWLAMTGGAAANGSPASAVTATVGMPMAAPALAPATDGVSVAPSPQHLAEAGLQDPAYLAWLAMTSKAAADASSPAAAAAPGAPLAAEATLDDVSSPLQGFPSQSTSSGDAQSPAADAPAVAAVQTSAAAVPAQSSLVPDPGDQGVDWAQFLTPSVLAAALQLAQNPFDPATWQRLLQSGAHAASRATQCHVRAVSIKALSLRFDDAPSVNELARKVVRSPLPTVIAFRSWQRTKLVSVVWLLQQCQCPVCQTELMRELTVHGSPWLRAGAADRGASAERHGLHIRAAVEVPGVRARRDDRRQHRRAATCHAAPAGLPQHEGVSFDEFGIHVRLVVQTRLTFVEQTLLLNVRWSCVRWCQCTSDKGPEQHVNIQATTIADVIPCPLCVFRRSHA